MYIIGGNDFLAMGSHRDVYKYRDDEDKCLKVVMRKKSCKWYKRFRPLSWYDENKKDIRAYGILAKKDFKVFSFIPKFYGVLKTDLGDALVLEYVKDAVNIGEYIEKKGFTEQLQNTLKDMFMTFYENNAQIRDQRLENYLVRETNGNLEVKLIDGIGNSQMIPLADYIPFIGKRQLVRRINRFLNNIYYKFPQYKGILKFEPQE